MTWKSFNHNRLRNATELQKTIEEANSYGVDLLRSIGKTKEAEAIQDRIHRDPEFPEWMEKAFREHGKRGERKHLGTLESAIIRRKRSRRPHKVPTSLLDPHLFLEQGKLPRIDNRSLVACALTHQLQTLWRLYSPDFQEHQFEFSHSLKRVSDAIQLILTEMNSYPRTTYNIGIEGFFSIPIKDALEGFPKIDSVSLPGPKRSRSSYRGMYNPIYTSVLEYMFIKRFLMDACGLSKARACYAGGILLWFSGLSEEDAIQRTPSDSNMNPFIRYGKSIEEKIRRLSEKYDAMF